MREQRRGTINSAGSIVRSGSGFVLLDHSTGSTARTATSKPAGPLTRRMSVLVDQQRQPIALLHSDGNTKEVIPIGPALRGLKSGDSLAKLFDDPYGVTEEPRISNISMPSFGQPRSSAVERSGCASRSEFEKQCQWKGEKVKETDYMLLNVTALFIITVIVTAIIFFSLWRDLINKVWVLYVGLGVSASLVLLALLLVKCHFYLKSQGFNVLFRNKGGYSAAHPAAVSKRSLDVVEESRDVVEESRDVEMGSRDMGTGNNEEAETLL